MCLQFITASPVSRSVYAYRKSGQGLLSAARSTRLWYFLFPYEDERPIAQAQPTTQPGDDRLYQEMQERIRYLESQVEEEREARRRADTLLARLMDRLPELESPQEPPSEMPGSSETTAEEPERTEPRPDAPGVQEGVQRPWWRRLLGG